MLRRMIQQAEISYLTLSEALQDIFLRQRTGVLHLSWEEGRDRLAFLGGQLYLRAGNPGGNRLAGILAGPSGADADPRFEPGAYLRRELDGLLEELEAELNARRIRDLRFETGVERIPDDLVGPVPTAKLLMDLYGRGWSFDELLTRLGGREAKYRARRDPRLRQRVADLDAGEVRLLERLHRPIVVEQLLSETDDRLALLCRLVRLVAVGMVCTVEPADRRPAGPSGDLVETLAERVRESLAEAPLGIDAQSHRARVGKLLSDYGRRDFYQLLGVDSSASSEEVHSAYMELARLAHPSHGETLGMGGRGRKLEWLFARLTEAYLVLSDPERAAKYRRGASVLPPPRVREPTAKARRSEQVRLARERYRLALDYIEEEDFFYAIQLLQQAVRADERPEYLALLANCQLQNPRWLNQAVDNLRRAVALRPDDEALRSQLEETKERIVAYRRAQQEPAEPAEEVRAEERRARRLLDKLRNPRE